MFAFTFLHLLPLFAIYLQVSASPISSKRATVCNGHAELCDRSYGNTTFLGSHDSFAFSKNLLALSRDQEVGITEQLNLGVRLLQAQAHEKNDDLHFCHTSCALFDGGTVLDYLKEVKSFLDAHPDEVLTLILTNPEEIPIKNRWLPIFDEAGISPMAFIPPNPGKPVAFNEWPTLRQMIDSGRRVVVFLDKGADKEGQQVDFVLNQFDSVWESPFSIIDPNFPCSVDRITGPLAVEDHTYMINHSLNKKILGFLGDGIIISDPASAERTNSIPSILAHAAGCVPLSGANRNPQFVLLDFVNIGEGLKSVDILNGLSAP